LVAGTHFDDQPDDEERRRPQLEVFTREGNLNWRGSVAVKVSTSGS
jgi:hypothetical protein